MAVEQVDIADRWDLDAFQREYERIRAMRLSDDELREMERRVRREMHELVRQRQAVGVVR